MSKDQLKAVSDALHNGAEPGDVWDTIKEKPLRRTCSCGTAFTDESGHDDELKADAWREYDHAAEDMARRGLKGACGDPLPLNMTPQAVALINDDVARACTDEAGKLRQLQQHIADTIRDNAEPPHSRDCRLLD